MIARPVEVIVAKVEDSDATVRLVVLVVSTVGGSEEANIFVVPTALSSEVKTGPVVLTVDSNVKSEVEETPAVAMEASVQGSEVATLVVPKVVCSEVVISPVVAATASLAGSEVDICPVVAALAVVVD